MNLEPYINLGALAIISLFAIKEFFTWMKSRKEPNGIGGAILNELRTMNENHLHSLAKAITEGNTQLTAAFISQGQAAHQDNMRIIEALGEIKGKLSKP